MKNTLTLSKSSPLLLGIKPKNSEQSYHQEESLYQTLNFMAQGSEILVLGRGDSDYVGKIH